MDYHEKTCSKKDNFRGGGYESGAGTVNRFRKKNKEIDCLLTQVNDLLYSTNSTNQEQVEPPEDNQSKEPKIFCSENPAVATVKGGGCVQTNFTTLDTLKNKYNQNCGGNVLETIKNRYNNFHERKCGPPKELHVKKCGPPKEQIEVHHESRPWVDKLDSILSHSKKLLESETKDRNTFQVNQNYTKPL